jgi:hypothetical protein
MVGEVQQCLIFKPFGREVSRSDVMAIKERLRRLIMDANNNLIETEKEKHYCLILHVTSKIKY